MPALKKGGRGPKARGDHYEREVAKYLNDTLGLSAFRTPLSGGGTIAKGNSSADITGTPGIALECKRCERLDIPAWMAQARKSCDISQTPDIPVIVTRKNRQTTGQSLVILSLDEFLPFYAAWLRERGYIKKPET